MPIRTLLLSFIACLLMLNAAANLSPTSLKQNEAGRWMYGKIIEVPATAKDALYERMKKWVLTNVKTVDQNTLTDDPVHETLITNVTLSP